MMPANAASAVAVPDNFRPPDGDRTSNVEDYERGGIAINDPSQGLDVQVWRCHLNSGGTAVVLTPESGSPVTVISIVGITELAFAFDVNMRPTIAYMHAQTMYLRWYDGTLPGFATTTIGTVAGGYRSPRLTLDDKRLRQGQNADVIFAYLKDDSLRYRQQRERYQTERTLRTGLPLTTKLRNLGMTRGLRLQFELVDG